MVLKKKFSFPKLSLIMHLLKQENSPSFFKNKKGFNFDVPDEIRFIFFYL